MLSKYLPLPIHEWKAVTDGMSAALFVFLWDWYEQILSLFGEGSTMK